MDLTNKVAVVTGGQMGGAAIARDLPVAALISRVDRNLASRRRRAAGDRRPGAALSSRRRSTWRARTDCNSPANRRCRTDGRWTCSSQRRWPIAWQAEDIHARAVAADDGGALSMLRYTLHERRCRHLQKAVRRGHHHDRYQDAIRGVPARGLQPQAKARAHVHVVPRSRPGRPSTSA